MTAPLRPRDGISTKAAGSVAPRCGRRRSHSVDEMRMGITGLPVCLDRVSATLLSLGKIIYISLQARLYALLQRVVYPRSVQWKSSPSLEYFLHDAESQISA